jgi:hypothetical protein
MLLHAMDTGTGAQLFQRSHLSNGLCLHSSVSGRLARKGRLILNLHAKGD